VLTFFGLMRGEAIGINRTGGVALAYLVVGGVLAACAKFATANASEPEEEENAAEGLGALAAE
jgi:AGZA family xanthine/uracil permease-like MFS transporter